MNELLAKYFSGDASDQERNEVEDWRNQSDENASEFLAASEVWNRMLTGKEYDPEVAFENVKRHLDKTETKVVAMEGESSASNRVNYLKYAAAIVMATGLGLIYWLMSGPSSQLMSYTTAAGEVLEVELEDGSWVTLNENSRLDVAEGFNQDTREVVLSGIAFFDVARDENKPFIIDAGDSRVKVLGTSFLVRSFAASPVTEVIVKSGSVGLANDKGRANTGIVLSAGEVGVADSRKSGVAKKNNRDVNYLAWKDKVITFERTSLTDVARVLSDVYKVELTFEGNIQNCQMTAQFQKQSLEVVIEIIRQTFGLEVKQKGNAYRFTGKGC